jgi:hypothetical protein
MNKVLIFILGAASGSLVTWKLIEKKYKQLADEEIADVIEHFKEKQESTVEPKPIVVHHTGTWPDKTVEEEVTEEEKEDYAKQVEDLGYSIENDRIEPYVISPDEFGDTQYYDTKNWTYYADFVLTDETGEIVADPESIIGDALEHFGDYEDDSVHVRNENTECDYEILKVCESFSEINGEDS